jgi:trimethylamine--corrinoid protein Co-methyltransferase
VDEKKGTALVPEKMVSDALRTVPKSIKICSRRGVDYNIPSDGVQLMSPDGQPPAVWDTETCEKRPSKLKDVIEMSIVSDALPEVGHVWPPVIATDTPAERSTYFEFLASMAYTSKHIQHGAISADEANYQIELAAAVLGSKEELKKRPIFSDVCTPISPLRWDRGEAEALVILSRAGVPMAQLSMGIAGSVTPVSIAGTMAIVNAENLCGLTMTQVASQGAPSIYSSFSGVMDLKTGVFICAAPEGILMDCAAVEMARHYRLPTLCGGFSNSSRTLSFESGSEGAMCAMAALLTGADMLVGLGGMDRAGMMCKEKIVLDAEVWRWLVRIRDGIQVDPDTLAFDAIKRQGPAGLFMSDPHTAKYMRKELLIPQVTGHHDPKRPGHSFDDLIEYSKKRTKEILATHKPQLFTAEEAARVEKVAQKHGVLLPNGKQIFEHQ